MNAFERYQDEFNWLYMELYNDRAKLAELTTALHALRKMRKPALKALDRARKPDWYKRSDLFGITMYTDLFAENLQGLKAKIPYLKELGIGYLHLMPLLKMPEKYNDGGYAVEDFLQVDPRFGDNQDLEDLCDSLRGAGISLCLDFVMNHTASSHAWAQKAKAGDYKYMGYYHIFRDWYLPGEYEKTLPQVFPTTAPGNFTYVEEMRSHVMTTFYPYQWDLNYANPNVFNDMLITMLKLCNMGVEVLRLDAVPYIWKELYTSCRNLPKVHTILRLMRIALDCVAPACIFKGEVVMPPHELAAYFGTEEKPECHVLYNVSSMVNMWSALASRDTRLLKNNLDILNQMPPHCYFVNYLRCHDDIGWGLDEGCQRCLGIDPLRHKQFLYHFFQGNWEYSYARGALYNYDPVSLDARSCGTLASLCGLESARFPEEVDAAIQRILFMHALMICIKGMPMLNSGDEIAQLNDWSYEQDEAKRDDSRYLHRSKFRHDKLALLAEPGSPEARVYHGIRSLEKQHSSHPCFHKDAQVYCAYTSNDQVLSYVREFEGRRLVCLYNFYYEPRGCYIAHIKGKFTDLFSGREVQMEDGLMLRPNEYLWLDGEMA